MADLKILKVANLLNITRTTTSSSYATTSDRQPMFHYDASAYDQVSSIYLQGVLRANSGDTAYLELYNFTDGVAVPGSEISTTSTSNVVVASGDIKSNLVDGKDYLVRWKADDGSGGSPSGTSAFDRSTINILQNGPVTKTETVIEIAEDNNVPSTSYSPPNDYAIFKYDASRFDGTVSIYLEAVLRCQSSGDTTYSALYDITSGSQVSSSEVSHTGDTTKTRKRSGAITLVDGHEYRADVKGTSTSDDIPSVSIVIQQTGSPTKTDSYIPMLNTVTSGTGSSYSYQNRYIDFDYSDFSGDTLNFLYEATFRSSSGNTAYYNLYNDTDSVQISELSTTSTSYTRVRSSSLTVPTDDNNQLNSGRKIDTSGTVYAVRSFLIVQADWSTSSIETASVSPLALSVTIPSVTATYTQVNTADVAPIQLSVTLPDVTATYSQVNTATVSPLQLAITIPGVTATYSENPTASVEPLLIEVTIPPVTATYVQAETATVSPLQLAVTIPDVTATYTESFTASVSPLQLSITIPDVTATYDAILSAVVSPLQLSLSIPDVTATYESVRQATVEPLLLHITIPEVTATTPTEYSAKVSPLLLEITIPLVTASGILQVTYEDGSLMFFDQEPALSSSGNRPSTVLSDIEPELADSDINLNMTLSDSPPVLL